MNITEALGDIAASFPRVENTIGNAVVKDDMFEASSGGVKKSARDPEPALYLTADAAVAFWHHQMLALLKDENAAAFVVIDGPHLDKWRITVADGKYTHRTAEDRYSVTARIGVIREAIPVAEPSAAVVEVIKTVDAAALEIAGMTPDLPKPKPAKAAKKKVAA